MDLNQLECLLQQLTEAKDQIIKTANYCSFYPESAQQIASMIENEFTQTRKDKKRIFLFLIHQIILDESQKKRQENPFLKAFGGKLKKLLGDFCIVDDIKDLESAYTMIKRWERDQIFHPQFIQKLRSILQPKYDQLKQQQETFNALNQTDASANKVLQHNIQTVQQIEQSHKIYKHLQQLADIDSKTLEFNCNYDKFDEKTTSNQDLQALIQEGEMCREQLIQSIIHLQQYYIEMAVQGENLQSESYQGMQKKIDQYKEKKKEW
ncbi:unnamed protein product [Paramecium octaurelia]|uniref:CID domain-containing protein n=1 Tax=Paramecium octaurelia TaxID=43137 RepID=A0A8S1TMG1_PAROT|nr:unnamed protein product [Paramecium octaurelia]